MRVAYGVQGEGMGHATRSACVISHLLSQGDEVEVFSSSRAYTYLSERFERVEEIKGFTLAYKDDRLLNVASTIEVIRTLPRDLVPTVRLMLERFRAFRPEVIITDHETFTAALGRLLSIPVIYAGNIAILERTRVDSGGLAKRYPKLLAQTTARLSSFRASGYVIPTFFYPKVKGSNVILTDPLVRPGLEGIEPTRGDHLFVYQTSPTNRRVLDALAKTGMECRVYGYGARASEGNLAFHAFDESAFAHDLASCRAAILGGGFSTISEALYFRKPIYSVPLRDHFEQMVNANEIEKRTFGEYHEEADEKSIFDFTLKLDLYQHYLDRYEMDPRSFERTVREVASIKRKKPSQGRVERLLTAVKSA